MGMPVDWLKLTAFSFGAAMAALTGTSSRRFTERIRVPDEFRQFPLLITIYAMVILGGIGKPGGSRSRRDSRQCAHSSYFVNRTTRGMSSTSPLSSPSSRCCDSRCDSRLLGRSGRLRIYRPLDCGHRRPVVGRERLRGRGLARRTARALGGRTRGHGGAWVRPVNLCRAHRPAAPAHDAQTGWMPDRRPRPDRLPRGLRLGERHARRSPRRLDTSSSARILVALMIARPEGAARREARRGRLMTRQLLELQDVSMAFGGPDCR